MDGQFGPVGQRTGQHVVAPRAGWWRRESLGTSLRHVVRPTRVPDSRASRGLALPTYERRRCSAGCATVIYAARLRWPSLWITRNYRTLVPTISVIVPVFNGIEHLPAFFDSLAAALPAGTQVIVVDDASTQPVLDAVPELPRAESVVCLRNEVNLGNSGAVNRGFAAATGDVVVQLNSDLVLDPGCVSAMVDFIAQGTDDVGIVGSKLIYPTTGRTQSVGMAFGHHSKRHVYRHLPEGHPLCCRTREVQVVTGATAAMTRRVLEQLGPLDDRLYNHNLDLDHCLRAAERGLRNFMCTDSIAYHWRNRSGPIRYARVEAAEAAFWGKWTVESSTRWGSEARRHGAEVEVWI